MTVGWQVDTVRVHLRKVVGLILVAAFVAPAAAAWCEETHGWGAMRSAHACCNTPRITGCECGDPGHSDRDSAEPAVRISVHAPQPATMDLPDDRLPAVRAPSRTWVVPSPPRDTGARLSLLSTLIV